MANEVTNKTFQSGIHSHQMNNLTDYALFLGGLNVTRDSLLQYDPLKTGFGRIFMIRQPIFVNNKIPTQMKKFKHVLEYANTGISGNTDIDMNFNDMNGGYTNKSIQLPSIATDSANELTIKTYEFSGSLMREVIQYWITGVSDLQSGLSTYHCDGTQSDANYGLEVCQANQTAEFIYVATDQTGKNIEYAALYANCFPKTIKLSQFDYDSGSHELTPMDITFTCTRYMSPQINEKAKQLLIKYNVLMDSLNFNSGYTNADLYADNTDNGSYYDINTGKITDKSSSQKGSFLNEEGKVDAKMSSN